MHYKKQNKKILSLIQWHQSIDGISHAVLWKKEHPSVENQHKYLAFSEGCLSQVLKTKPTVLVCDQAWLQLYVDPGPVLSCSVMWTLSHTCFPSDFAQITSELYHLSSQGQKIRFISQWCFRTSLIISTSF